MKSLIYKYTVGTFSIKEAFEITDAFFGDGCLSSSCAKKGDDWFVEILHDKLIEKADIQNKLSSYKVDYINIEELEDINWLQRCFENFKPIEVGSFYIYGPHLREKNVPANRIPIEIAAATAFGSGEHPTTRGCLLASEAFFDYKIHKAVLDIGCGSCILSIGLAKLGAKYVSSCDNDPEAVRISNENIVINKVSHRISVFQNSACEFSANKYDFVVANILAEPLISMSESVVRSLNQNAILVLSGFKSEDSSVVDRYLSLGLSLKYRYDNQGWTTLVMTKR